jgi:hypothetical protein
MERVPLQVPNDRDPCERGGGGGGARARCERAGRGDSRYSQKGEISSRAAFENHTDACKVWGHGFRRPAEGHLCPQANGAFAD